ncbi:DUF167 domain-containing protein [Chloroflexota bacterium]
MTSREFHLHNGKKGAALAIRLITRARKNEIVEVLHDGTVKIRLKAAPVGNKANQALVEFLAEVLKVPAKYIEVVAGEGRRDKLVSVLDLDANTVHERIIRNIA